MIQVTPAIGMIKPEQSIEVVVRHDEYHTSEEFVDGIPQSWWSEDTRDKEVILLINVEGSRSMESRTHQLHVRHCFTPGAPISNELRSSSTKRTGSSHHRASLKHVGSANNMVDDQRNLRVP